MRGARQGGCGCSRHGIIPADAGSTTCFEFKLFVGQDHPRGCGEHFIVMVTFRPQKGSSPRMRGALATVIVTMAMARIIPADAGSTDGNQRRPRGSGDHPRGCGEHFHDIVTFP